MSILVIDIGTTNVKSALFSMAEKPADSPGQAEPVWSAVESKDIQQIPMLPNKNPRIFEFNAEEIFAETDKLISGYCQTNKGIEGLVFSTQMHGCVYPDRARGMHVYLSWQDTRCLDPVPGTSESPLDRLGRLLGPGELVPSGVPVKPALAFANLYAMSCTDPRWKDLYSDMEIFTLGSYLIWRLTGRNITHISNAAPMGMADVRKGEWLRDLWKKAGLGGIKHPEIVCDLKSCGEFNRNGMTIKVYPDIGDQQVSILGCGVKEGDVIVNAATAGQVIRVNGAFVPGDYEIRPFFNGMYLDVVSRMPAGRSFDVLIDFISETGRKFFGVSLSRGEIWKKLRNGCRIGEDTGGLEGNIGFFDLPNREAGGALTHIMHHNFTPDNVISAFLKDAAELYGMYCKKFLGSPQKGRLVFCGGLAGHWPDFSNAILRRFDVKPESKVVEGESHKGMGCIASMAAGS